MKKDEDEDEISSKTILFLSQVNILYSINLYTLILKLFMICCYFLTIIKHLYLFFTLPIKRNKK